MEEIKIVNIRTPQIPVKENEEGFLPKDFDLRKIRSDETKRLENLGIIKLRKKKTSGAPKEK